MKTKTPRGAFLFGLLVIGCLLVSTTLTGCQNEPELESGENNITSFKIGDAVATISGDAIYVVVPADSDLTGLTPEISVSGGASVSPGSGVTHDFTASTTYTVKAENGTTRNYAVTVMAAALSGEKNITSFKIENATAAIYDNAISVYVPADTNLTTLSPEITVSAKATVSPVSGAANNFTNPTTYTVTAEDGTTRNFVVTVSTEEVPVLQYLTVVSQPSITNYTAGTELNLNGLVVRGDYSDGSSKIETVTAENISNYDKDTLGSQTVVVSIQGKTATFTVYVEADTSASLNLTLALVADGNDRINVYGIPQDGIKLSRSGADDLPKYITISTGSLYDIGNVSWYVDGNQYSYDNIITLDAQYYTLTQPHNITVIAYRNGTQYSTSITFTVAK